MLQTNRVKDMLKAGQTTIGAWVQFGSADSAEIMSRMGLDWLVFDTEHGPWSLETIQEQIRATADTPIVPIVRVAWNDMVLIKRALDIGAYGVVIPWVNNREQAEAAVRACKYPPEGLRGCGPRRAAMFGLETKEYLEKANDLILVIVQIETMEAVENLEEIMSVQGIDAIFVGPADLASSLGVIGQQRHPKNLETIARILDTATRANMPVGIFGMGPEYIKEHIDQGFKFVVLGADASFMMHGLRDILKRIDRS